MQFGVQAPKPAATVDLKQLNTVRWGPMRQLFPAFVEELELGRYLKQLLTNTECRTVQLRPHRDTDGRVLEHVFDVFFVDPAPA